MGWSKGLLSVGGVTQGQVIPASTSMFYPWTVAPNDYTIIQNNNGADGVDHDITSLSCDLPYTEGETLNDFVAAAKFPVTDDDGVILNYIGIRYKYRSEIAFGVSRLSVDMEMGYWDTQNNWVSMGGRGCGTYSQQTFVYPFKIKLHLCSGKTTGETPYEFFGAVISIEAADRAMFVYAGILSSQTYVRGNKDEIGDFSPEFGPGSEPEGYDGGTFDDHSDPIDFPTDPQSILSLGFINVYKCSANSLIDFGATLFPEITFPTSLSDVGAVIAAVSDSIWNSRLIDYVISVHCVPGDVAAGALEDIKVGARTMTGILARKISSEYVTIDMGTIETGRIFKNYIDLMTGCKIFLPFYGFVDLAPEYWNGCTLHVKYKFNVIDGSFMAYIKASNCYYSKLDGIIGQYSGTACVHIPTTGNNYSTMFSTLIGSGAGLAASVASGNIGGVASNAVNVANALGSVGQSSGGGSYNASSSFMSMRQPFLQIEIPVPSFSVQYAPESGLPSNVAYELGSLRGLVKCDNPKLNFVCSEQEAKEIIAALQEGVII